MPDNLDNYKELIIEDALATVLDTESPTAEAIKSRINIFVNDLPDDSLKDDLSIKEVNGHKVLTYHIPETNVEKIKELEGKTLRLEILASLDAAADFDNSNDTLVFNEDGIYKVKNEAVVKVLPKDGAQLTVTSDPVWITVPGEEPTIEKSVELKVPQAGFESSEGHLNLPKKTSVFNYKIDLSIPSNVENFETLIVQDTLD